MTRRRATLILRVALAIGFCIDVYVAALSLFAPRLIPPLLDIPVHDPTLVTIAGGEYAVAALVYLLALRDPRRFQPLLWLCALDQAFAVVLPALAVVHGQLPPSWKIVAPLPVSALLAAIYVVGALRPGAKRSATPSMQ